MAFAPEQFPLYSVGGGRNPRRGPRRPPASALPEGSRELVTFLVVLVTLASIGAVGRADSSFERPHVSPGPQSSSTCLPGSGAGPVCPTSETARNGQPFAVVPRGWINVTAGQSGQPPMQLWASLAYDPVDRYLVLFGGCTVSVCPIPSQTWTYFNGTWHNITSLGPQPPAREYAHMVFDGTDGYILLYGGVGSTVLSDTWSFAGGHWTNRTNTVGAPPPARWGGGFAYDPSANSSLLFGGMSTSGRLLNDTWAYSGGHWTNLTGSVGGAPPPRYEASMAWDNTDKEVVLVDGCGALSCPVNNTWSFSAGRWTNITSLSTPAPPARFLSTLSFDAASGSLRLFGGLSGTGSLGDTWSFSGNHWSNLTGSFTESPRPREGSATPEDTVAWVQGSPHTLPFDLLYGGDWVSCSNCPLRGLSDTWAYESPPSISASVSPDVIQAGQNASFRQTLSGGSPPYSYFWNFSDGTFSQAADASHRFATPGTVVVSAVGRDAAGATANATVRLSVTGITPPASPLSGTTGVVLFVIAPLGGIAVVTSLLVWRHRKRQRTPPVDR